MAEKKWDKSDNYVFNFHQGEQDKFYLAQVVFHNEKQEMKIEAEIHGYYLVICNIEYNPDTNEIGGADPFYSDIRLLVATNKRGEKNYKLALDKMEEEAWESIMVMESDKKFLESLAKENDIDVDEMRKKLKKLQEDVNCGDDFGMKFGLEEKEKVKKEEPKKAKNKTTFKDIAGMENVKEVLLEVIDQFKYPEDNEFFDITPYRSLLLHGKPGTGKTYIANAFANEMDAKFVKVSLGEMGSIYKNGTSNNIAKMFKEARENEKPVILFLDEVDAIASKRSNSPLDKSDNATLNTLLQEMSSDNNDNIFLVFATNFVELLDDAFLRVGRCDLVLEVPLPDFETRLQILKLNTKKKPLSEDVNLEVIAEEMNGKNCADMAFICSQAARIAKKKYRDNLREERIINQDDFMEALEKMNGKKEEEKVKQIGFALNK